MKSDKFRLILSKKSEKFINTHKLEGAKFLKAFSEFRDNPVLSSNYDIKKYHHKKYDDIFRLRIGKYRAIFRIVKNELIIFVIDIDSRGDIYK